MHNRSAYVYIVIITSPNPMKSIKIDKFKSQIPMLYDTYGEEYLIFLQELNEILSINELVELDYM